MLVRLVKENFIDAYEKSLLDFAEEFSEELGIRLNIKKIPPIVLSLDTPKDATDIQGISIDNSDRLGDKPHGEAKNDAIDPKKKSLEDAASNKISIGGRFIYHKPKCLGENTLIEIYVRNFEKDLSMDEFNEYLRYVIAHEFFHYIHYLYDEKTLSDTSKEARIICEASAEYFAYLYLQKTANEFTSDVLNRRYNLWQDIQSIYSNVLCFLGSFHPGIDDLYWVLEDTKYAIEDGYRILRHLSDKETETFIE